MAEGQANKLGKLKDFWSRYGLQMALISVLGLAALSFLALGFIKLTSPPTQPLPMVATKVSQPIQAPPEAAEPRLPQPLPPLIQSPRTDESLKTETDDQGQDRVRGQVIHPDSTPAGPETSPKPAEATGPSQDATPPTTAPAATVQGTTTAASGEPVTAPASTTRGATPPASGEPVTAPASTTRGATPPASGEPVTAPAAQARLKPVGSQGTAANEAESPPATATATADTPPAQEPPAPPQKAPTSSQAPSLDKPPAAVPLESTVATADPTAPAGPTSADTMPQAEDHRPKVPKPRWQTVDENWDKTKLADMGPDTMDTGNAPWKQIDVGEKDQTAATETVGQDIPQAPLMTSGPDQATPSQAAKAATKSAATKTPAQTGKKTPVKSTAKTTDKTRPGRAATQTSQTRTAGTGAASAPARPGVTLSIINETGRPGQGNVYRDVLQAMGYKVQNVVDRPPQSGPTTILYNSGLKDKAQALAHRLPGQRTLAPQTSPASSDIIVMIR